MRYQLISGVIERSIPDEAEALTWRTSDYRSDLAPSDTRMCPDVLSIDLGDASTYRRTFGEVELVNRAMDGVVLDGGTNLESCLLEAKTQSASPGKQIDCDGMSRHVIET
jgi:hypothetical protein